ncbi:GNAT family N-acetyltransferase [Vibrio sp. SCSIO 43136]|uniref:GNAT family N-acetyltransferase n=1 Tax=Vibrio sp. SCSIO 43136 TaxID=2819101 RepID=UPI002074DB91|nr:GNAT family N-acetyltransferase [Vibrio sp. SCSIO 43136]USD66779.1 GNAT family N-acetyltransferase [Vibrio sp. SCSIO 43136]
MNAINPLLLNVSKSITNKESTAWLKSEGRVCASRFQQSLKDELFQVALATDRFNQPIGYCAYWIDVVNSGRYFDKPVLFFQVHYVYVLPSYRGAGVSAKLAEVMLRDIQYQLNGSYRVAAYCDKSSYVSDEGCGFKRMLHRQLRHLYDLPFV